VKGSWFVILAETLDTLLNIRQDAPDFGPVTLPICALLRKGIAPSVTQIAGAAARECNAKASGDRPYTLQIQSNSC
jgi:hypothetical protein